MLLKLFLLGFAGTASCFSVENRRVFVGTPITKHTKHLVEDCMDRTPLVLTENTSTEEAIAAMLTHSLSGAPVVSEKEPAKLVGICTSFDFLQKEAFEGALLPMEGSQQMVEQYVSAAKKICAQRVGDIMSKNPSTIEPQASMRDAAAQMAKEGVHRLPVVSDGEFVGMLSAAHVMKDVLNIHKNLPQAQKETEAEDGVEEESLSP